VQPHASILHSLNLKPERRTTQITVRGQTNGNLPKVSRSGRKLFSRNLSGNIIGKCLIEM
jgi:hypothetical protein